ncbi:MAG: leucine-rich repeat domain-containing protein, partial [Clostridia bacterium]|nr:leucine-rich repeat domain-containing protein [Clostridia bacterium]
NKNDVYKIGATINGVAVLNSPYEMNVGICQPEDITFVVDNESGIFYVGETYYFEADYSHTTALLSWKVNGVEYDRGARFNFTFETPGTYEITLLAHGRTCTSMIIEVWPVPTTENPNRCGDDLYWDFDEETGVLTITGTGAMYHFKNLQSPWYDEYFDSIKEVVIGAEVESIGAYAFSGCDVLRNVIVETNEDGENALTAIDKQAFAGCVNLEGIYGLTNVETIGEYAFMDCIQLASINAEEEIALPTTLTELGFATFYNCDGIYQIVIPVGVTEIPAYAFYACDNLEEVHMHDQMDKINVGAFVRCDFLSEVYIYDTDVEIAGKAFSNYGEWDIVFFGYAGSTAEEYATTYGEDFYDLGFQNALGFEKKSVSLGNKFTINYYLNSNILDGYTNTYVRFEKPVYDVNGEIIDHQIDLVTDYVERIIGGVTYYVYAYDNIQSYELGSTITATINTTSVDFGVVYTSNEIEYSIKMYAEKQLANTKDAELKTLLVDMLNYGASSQLYFDYNVSDLANAGLTDEQKACATEEMAEVNSYKSVETNPNATVAIKGTTLNLVNNVEVVYYLDLKEYHADDVHAVITYVDYKGRTQTVTVDGVDFEEYNNAYRFVLADLTASDMRTVCTMVVYDSHTNEAISDSYTYSIESYIASAMSKMTDAELLTLLESMIKYGDSAKAYFA